MIQQALNQQVSLTTRGTLGNGLITNRAYFSTSARLNTVQTGPSGSPTAVQSDAYLRDVFGRITQRSNKAGPNVAPRPSATTCSTGSPPAL